MAASFQSFATEARLSVSQINSLRKNLIQNMGFMNSYKPFFNPEDYNMLTTLHQRSLDTLNNMMMLIQCKESGSLIYDQSGRLVPTSTTTGNNNNNNKMAVKKPFLEDHFETVMDNVPLYINPPKNTYDPSLFVK